MKGDAGLRAPPVASVPPLRHLKATQHYLDNLSLSELLEALISVAFTSTTGSYHNLRLPAMVDEEAAKLALLFIEFK